MPTVSKKKIEVEKITVVKNMRDYSKDPYFQKKLEDAAKFIKKHGLPKDFKRTK